jgi:hypothetical protein
MRINGEWVRFADGEHLPIVRGQVIALDGTPVETLFLIDTGADRTVLTSDVLEHIGIEAVQTNERIVGVGGRVNSAQVATEIRLRREDGRWISFNGPFWALTEASTLDLSVLGRDILGWFALIVDRPGNTICLLNQRHRYTITAT